ncbi:MAG: hypothetical protein RCG15_03075 [Candidatus Rickettsia vulgarisii]
MEQLKKQGKKIDKKEEHKISSKLVDSLKKLDKKFLDKHKEDISKDLAKGLDSYGKTSLLGKKFTISIKNLHNFVSEIGKFFQEKNNKAAEKYIDQKIFALKLSDKELMKRYQQFNDKLSEPGMKAYKPSNWVFESSEEEVSKKLINPT